MGYSPQGHKESDTTERLHYYTILLYYVYAHIHSPMYTVRVYVTHFPAGAGAADGGGYLSECALVYAHTQTLIYCESVCHALPCRCRRSRWGAGTSPSVHSSMMIQTGFSVMTPISFTM